MFHHFIIVRDCYFSSYGHLCTRYSSYTQPKLLSKSGSCFSDRCFLLASRAAQQMSIYVTISHLVMFVVCLLLLLMFQRSLSFIYVGVCWGWERNGAGCTFAFRQRQIKEVSSHSLPPLYLSKVSHSQWVEKGIIICSYSLNVCCRHWEELILWEVRCTL